MYEYRHTFHITRMAKVLQVSESGYYKWLQRRNAPETAKDLSDRQLIGEIERLFRESRGSYGIRKITASLRDSQLVNHKRVERLMKKRGLFSRTSHQYIVTTDSDHDEPVAENLLNRDFHAERPNEKMVSDTTVIMTSQGKLYVAAILDLYGRRLWKGRMYYPFRPWLDICVQRISSTVGNLWPCVQHEPER